MQSPGFRLDLHHGRLWNSGNRNMSTCSTSTSLYAPALFQCRFSTNPDWLCSNNRINIVNSAKKKNHPNFPISVLLKQHPWHIFFENVSSNLKKIKLNIFTEIIKYQIQKVFNEKNID